MYRSFEDVTVINTIILVLLDAFVGSNHFSSQETTNNQYQQRSLGGDFVPLLFDFEDGLLFFFVQ